MIYLIVVVVVMDECCLSLLLLGVSTCRSVTSFALATRHAPDVHFMYVMAIKYNNVTVIRINDHPATPLPPQKKKKKEDKIERKSYKTR